MDRFERYSVYLISWGNGATPASPVGANDPSFPGMALASGIGCYQHARKAPLMSLDAFDRCADDLAAGRAWSSAEAESDECDVGPSARDERIMAEAHARLSKLILAGGHVETGGRSLYESAGDEIVRLNAELDLAQAGAGRWCAELQQAKEALTQARALADGLRDADGVLRREVSAARDELGAKPGETLREAARRIADALMRELAGGSAAEMRERAAAWCERLATLEKYGISRRALEMAAGSIRALPLSGAPEVQGGRVVHDRTAGQWWEPVSGPDGKGRVLRSVAPQSNWDAEQAGLSAEDAETLRGAGWRTLEDGRWVGPIAGAVFNPASTVCLRVLRGKAAKARALKEPAPARGEPGKATGAEAAEAGPGSVAEDRGAAQGARPCEPICRVGIARPGYMRHLDGDATCSLQGRAIAGPRCAVCGSQRGPAESPHACAPAALPKPKRVEVGQRWSVDWRDLTGDVTEYAVESVNDDTARLIGGSKGVSYRSTAEMLTSLRWTFLGPAPQDPPKRGGEAEAPVFVPGPVEVHGDPTPRGAYVVGPVSRCAPADGHPIEALTSADGRVTLILRDKADARAAAAACVELLGLSSDEVHGGNVVEAFEAGVAEGTRRGKAKATELATSWDADCRTSLRLRDAVEPTSVTWARRDSSAAIRRSCVLNLCDTFDIEGPPTGEPAPEASEVVAPPATTAVQTDWTMGPDGLPDTSCRFVALRADLEQMIRHESNANPHAAAHVILSQLAHVHGLAPRDAAPSPASPPGAPDRETLGRAAHAAWLKVYRPNGGGTSWEDQDEEARECDRRMGERLFNMGVQWARQNAAAPPAEPEAQDERWRPGAVWEHRWTLDGVDQCARLTVDRVTGSSMFAIFAGGSNVLINAMTPDAGWRYVGPAKAG